MWMEKPALAKRAKVASLRLPEGRPRRRMELPVDMGYRRGAAGERF